MTAAAFTWTDRAVREALGLRLEAADPDRVYTGVTTDSRTAAEGELYVALVGERFDGHDFVADALAAGAAGAVVSRPCPGLEGAPLYPVDDTLVALGDLARYRRLALPARVVGITGSSGKTGTKDFTAAALGSERRVHATPGNLNNRIGVPLTLLAAPPGAEVLVVEMGTNEPGEIGILADIARPDVGVVVTVGPSHLEKLGSVEGVLHEKLDMVRALDEGDTAIVGDEPPSLPRTAREIHPRVRVAGWGDEADGELRPREVEVDHWGYHRFTWSGVRVALEVAGRHAVANALLALAVADELGVSPASAAGGVGRVKAASLRGETRRVGPLTLILDCYNANPQSVEAAVEVLASRGDEIRRIVFLGTMLELGERAAELHRDTLQAVLDREPAVVVATGMFAGAAASVDPGRTALIAEEDPDAAYDALLPGLSGDEVVLLKASRGVALEALVERFEADFGEADFGETGAPDRGGEG